ncbi:helix-turn-helix domain-containing protein [Candidatus Tisiphia endosymbiont of Neophilaenus lineatus]|uniref:helix-turn-helix domain-containing protein n=1 Tax=Candidatus Tisiphia endosymbiont of Neophilaenus lineatus TaxID=3139336 RepID=UPI0035C9E8FB
MARLILPQGFEGHDFIKMMKHEPHGRNRIRLLAMYHLQLGKSFKAISEIVKSHWKTVQSSLRRFRNHGFEGLFESQRSGAPRKINSIQESAIFDKINTLSESKTGGYITGKELHIMLVEEYGAKCAVKTVYNTMHRLGFSWITSRSMHPKSNQETQNRYKKTFQTC